MIIKINKMNTRVPMPMYMVAPWAEGTALGSRATGSGLACLTFRRYHDGL
jgi:hypothetical protein